MNTDSKQQRLVTSFYTAITWNALSYIVHKTSYMMLSLILYTHLSRADFALWASLMSFMFLWLLILDCGFRKSVPRYCPEFSRNAASHTYFMRFVITLQIGILMIMLPVYYYVILPYFFTSMSYSHGIYLGIIATFLCFLQGCVGLLRLIYYAHFWNKQFNAVTAITTFLEFLLIIACCFMTQSNTFLLPVVLASHCISALGVIMLGYYKMPSRVTDESDSEPVMMRPFIIHSCFMWFANMLKSLTERNFLLPYIIYYLGPGTGIVFKLAHDAALFFYRSALKTLATNDTGLLSYARYEGSSSHAFMTLQRTVIFLVSLLIGVASIGLMYICYATSLACQTCVLIFCVCLCGYMLEIALSPYERMLEVALDYRSLAQAYVPYCCVLALLLYYQLITVIGLIPFMIILQGLRAVSSCIMAYKARKRLKV